MKKTISILTAVMLILSAYLPMQVSATESNFTDHDQILTVAREVFPEYADKLCEDGSSLKNAARSVVTEIYPVIQETRQVDEQTTMTYTEHNNGIVTLGTLRFSTAPSMITEEYESSGTFERYTVTLIGTVVEGNGDFVANNVVYGIYKTTFDRIIDTGSYFFDKDLDHIKDSNETTEIYVGLCPTETASDAASVTYSFPLVVGISAHEGVFTLSVESNIASVSYGIIA